MPRYTPHIAFCIICCLIASAAVAGSYYIDADGGSDGNSGTSPASAWASLSKASSFTFSPGDNILLQCGDTFNGKLVFDNENGTAPNPIVVQSYGTGNRITSSP